MRFNTLLGLAALCAAGGGCAIIYGYGDYQDAQQACTVPADCPGEDTECQVRACNNGLCSMDPEVDGKIVQAQIPGDCQRIVCSNGGFANIPDDADGADDASECTQDYCLNGVPQHDPVPEGTPCGAGMMTTCDARGNCTGCEGHSDCGNADECKSPTCDDGVCNPNNAPAETPCENGPTCGSENTHFPGGLCNGAGTCGYDQEDPCGLYLCQPQGCPPACATEQECALGASCAGGKCCYTCGQLREQPDPVIATGSCPGSDVKLTALRTCACEMGTPCYDLCSTRTVCGGVDSNATDCDECIGMHCLVPSDACTNDTGIPISDP